MPTLALSMIVRDAEKDLPACLESARGLVDEIVVADTGSTDATPEVARRYGAQVFSIPWEQDYARARNLALAEVRSDWVLMLDADEQLDPGAARVLPRLMEKKDIAGYQITIRTKREATHSSSTFCWIPSTHLAGTAPYSQCTMVASLPVGGGRKSGGQ